MKGTLTSHESGSEIFDPGQVNFLMLGSGQPLENFPQNPEFFNFFPFGSKKSHWPGQKITTYLIKTFFLNIFTSMILSFSTSIILPFDHPFILFFCI